jgi:hypothetical protein
VLGGVGTLVVARAVLAFSHAGRHLAPAQRVIDLDNANILELFRILQAEMAWFWVQ